MEGRQASPRDDRAGGCFLQATNRKWNVVCCRSDTGGSTGTGYGVRGTGVRVCTARIRTHQVGSRGRWGMTAAGGEDTRHAWVDLVGNPPWASVVETGPAPKRKKRSPNRGTIPVATWFPAETAKARPVPGGAGIFRLRLRRRCILAHLSTSLCVCAYRHPQQPRHCEA